MTKTSEEKAVVRAGAFGGLGDFTAADLIEATQNSDAEKGSATGEEIRDAMGNVRPTLESVKIKGHGANLFLFPDDSKVDGEKGIVGVVVAYTRHNSYFGIPFGEQEKGQLPACFSNDGETVAPNAGEPVAEACGHCHRNRDARARGARDAAFGTLKDEGPVAVCNNYLSIAFAIPGRDVPVRIRFTRQSFKAWAEYVQRIGTTGRFLPHEVLTRITLENRKGTVEYSVARFSMVGEKGLPTELRDTIASQRDSYRALLQRTAEGDEHEASASDEARQAVAAARAQAEAASTDDAGL